MIAQNRSVFIMQLWVKIYVGRLYTDLFNVFYYLYNSIQLRELHSLPKDS